MLITPSRLPAPVLAAAVATAGQAARALGLTRGPVHAELRIDERDGQARPVMLELAARSISGLCSRALRFGGGMTLEELVLANALGHPTPRQEATQPAGVLMLPVPRHGVLRAVEGRDDARAVPGITGTKERVAAVTVSAAAASIAAVAMNPAFRQHARQLRRFARPLDSAALPPIPPAMPAGRVIELPGDRDRSRP